MNQYTYDYLSTKKITTFDGSECKVRVTLRHKHFKTNTIHKCFEKLVHDNRNPKNPRPTDVLPFIQHIVCFMFL